MPEPLYITIEPIYMKDPHVFGLVISNYKFGIPRMPWSKFKEKYGSCYVTSVRDFDDTHTTSIIFTNIDPGCEPSRSVHTKEHEIKWLKG